MLCLVASKSDLERRWVIVPSVYKQRPDARQRGSEAWRRCAQMSAVCEEVTRLDSAAAHRCAGGPRQR